MRKTDQHVRACVGFTLIELLVVIAIISLLMSILMPALGQAREQAKRVVCLTNLRSLGTAISNYASEFREVIVPGSYYYGTESGAPRQDWPAILAEAGYINAPIYDEDEAPSTGEPTPEAAMRTNIVCPSAPRNVRENWDVGPFVAVGPVNQPADDPETGERRRIYFSYGSNGSNSVAHSQLPMKQYCDPENNPNSYMQARKPADLVLLYDGSWSHNGWQIQRITANHMNRTETGTLLMDGHAEGFARENLPMPELGDFGDLGYLKDNYPYPLWRFDQ